MQIDGLKPKSLKQNQVPKQKTPIHYTKQETGCKKEKGKISFKEPSLLNKVASFALLTAEHSLNSYKSLSRDPKPQREKKTTRKAFKIQTFQRKPIPKP